MKQLNFDTGIQEFMVNGTGILRFNPGDPNLYARFLDALEKIQNTEADLVNKGKAQGAEKNEAEDLIFFMREADKEAKDILAEAFGNGNDFDQIFGGVNLMAVAGNGERAITNFINAITPIITEGAEHYAKQLTATAVERANQRRGEK